MIKFVVFDFDGVFTDGKVYFDCQGNIQKYYTSKPNPLYEFNEDLFALSNEVLKINKQLYL